MREVREFVRAALVTPVPRDHTVSASALRRRRLIAAVTLAAGMVLLAYAVRTEPGDRRVIGPSATARCVWDACWGAC